MWSWLINSPLTLLYPNWGLHHRASYIKSPYPHLHSNYAIMIQRTPLSHRWPQYGSFGILTTSSILVTTSYFLSWLQCPYASVPMPKIHLSFFPCHSMSSNAPVLHVITSIMLLSFLQANSSLAWLLSLMVCHQWQPYSSVFPFNHFHPCKLLC